MRISEDLRMSLSSMTPVQTLYAGVYLAKRAGVDYLKAYTNAYQDDPDADPAIASHIESMSTLIEKSIDVELDATGRALGPVIQRRIESLIDQFIGERTGR